jgi:hypothetical protein
MPTFTFTSPDGKTHEVVGPEGATAEQAFDVLKTRLAGQAKQVAEDTQKYSPANDTSNTDKFLAGAGASYNRLAGGASDLYAKTGLPGSEGAGEFAKGQKEDYDLYKKYHPGGWGTAGELTGDVVATLPVGGVLGAASKALPAAGRLAAVGGRFVNPGTAGRAAIEAGTVAGIEQPGEGETRLGNMGEAAALGGVASKVVPAVASGGKNLVKYLGRKGADWTTGGTRQAEINAVKALDRTVGREGIDAAAESVRNPTPSMFPRTTAAMTGNRQLGALEAGAAGRPAAADFMTHREDVARKAWEELQGATKSATHDVPGLGAMSDDEAEAAIKAAQNVRGSFMENGFPKTTRSFGSVTEGTAIPEIRETALRRTMAKNAGRMVPEEAEQAGRIADELVPQEISQTGQHVGPTEIAPSGAVQTANAALNVLPQWRWRGMAQQAIRGSNKAEQEQIDQALLSPEKFLKMVETQRALGRPLTGWQAKVRDVMLGAQAREIGAQSAGDQNAP